MLDGGHGSMVEGHEGLHLIYNFGLLLKDAIGNDIFFINFDSEAQGGIFFYIKGEVDIIDSILTIMIIDGSTGAMVTDFGIISPAAGIFLAVDTVHRKALRLCNL
jgi:hypothetical protein